MSEVFGHRWSSQHGDEPSDTWVQGLADLSAADYAKGFRALLDRTDHWPPTLPEFRQLATGRDGLEWERRAHREFDPGRAIERKPMSLEDRMAALKKLREEFEI